MERYSGVRSGVRSAPGPLRTLRCMQGIVSGGLLVAAFVAVAGLALVVAARLYRMSRPGQPAGQAAGPPGEPPDA
jgi:hypothetical protein